MNIKVKKQGVFFAATLAFALSACSPGVRGTEDFVHTTTIGGRSVIISRYTGASPDVVIPGRIGRRPVTSIGGTAFSLTSLSWPGTTMVRITSVVIPDSVNHIADGAFSGHLLEDVTIPASLTTINPGVFARNQLRRVTIPASVTTISADAFRQNQISDLEIGSSVIMIGPNAFSYNRLTSVFIPPSVATIESGAFRDNQITKVIFHPDSSARVHPYAFYGNQLTRVVIPASVSFFGGSQFDSHVEIMRE